MIQATQKFGFPMVIEKPNKMAAILSTIKHHLKTEQIPPFEFPMYFVFQPPLYLLLYKTKCQFCVF